MSNNEQIKAYTIVLMMLIVLTFIAITLSIESIMNYLKNGEMSLAFLTAMPIFLCVGSTFAIYKRYSRLKSKISN